MGPGELAMAESAPDGLDPLFAAIEALRPLPPGGRDELRRITRPCRLAKGAFFLRAGEVPSLAAFMTTGWLRYSLAGEDGREYIRHFCGGNSFVADSAALAAGRPSEYSIQAIEDCSLLTFAYKDWIALGERRPAWLAIHGAILDRALDAAERRARSLVLDDAAKRYRLLLKEFPGIEDHVRQYDIASYLGINPVSLSRIRASSRAKAGPAR
jgi:CRP-like cAMP-binding protein